MIPQAFIAAAKRTPFGTYGGSLKSLTAAQLGGHASKAALAQLPVETKVDQVIVSERWLKTNQVKPLTRIVSHHTVAVEPAIMGIGPVGAIQGALQSAGLTIGQIDLFDVNEAFAAQWLAVAKELELPWDRSNMFGGAIALGHPLGASGARILNNLTYNLIRLNKKYGVGAACIGGGQGIAVVLERC